MKTTLQLSTILFFSLITYHVTFAQDAMVQLEDNDLKTSEATVATADEKPVRSLKQMYLDQTQMATQQKVFYEV